MGDDFGPYLQLAEQSQQSGTPAISLELKAPETLFSESDFGIEVVLRRDDTEPLVRVSSFGLLMPRLYPLLSLSFSTTLQTDWKEPGQDLFELQPNGNSRHLSSLGLRYHYALRPGERYELLWPEGETSLWDWGNIQNHLGRGANHSISRALAAQRAIIQSVPGDFTPITLHVINLLEGNLQRQRGQRWEYFKSEVKPYQIYDEPDIEFSPGQHVDFISLQPGESWTRTDRLELPSDTKVREVFKYEFTDRVIDWWNWGMKEDHLQTTVKLPCRVSGEVVDPRDNEGQPAIV
ncbi:hypothetical protein ETB97_009408 [Aspergillus alliaceus]|uniref:Uncharacterized protein n=1 Tax=Petromyces alliaceus TaxID=209559 RepID=A0A8H6ADD1_PETAA|nr:hypothetical protein ETB97_009408 [Aspergillus burnettii]